MYRKGTLVPTSLDLYLALEFCDQGDLFHMRGQVRAEKTKPPDLQGLGRSDNTRNLKLEPYKCMNPISGLCYSCCVV